MGRGQLVGLFSFLSLAMTARTGAGERAGSVDLSFDAGLFWSDVSYGVGGYGKVIALALEPNEEIYMGHFTAFGLPWMGGRNWNGIARRKNDGSLDETFAIPLFDQFMWRMNHIGSRGLVPGGTQGAGKDNGVAFGIAQPDFVVGVFAAVARLEDVGFHFDGALGGGFKIIEFKPE